MRKYMKFILAGLAIAMSAQITSVSYALESNTNQTTQEKNVSKNSNYTKSAVAAVKNEKELISALENESIITVDIKNDIVIKGDPNYAFSMDIKGKQKEIKGNGYTLSGAKEDISLWVRTNTKIDNLKLIQIRIASERVNLDIVNNSEINNGVIEYCWNATLENIKVNNTIIRSDKNLVIKSSKMKDSSIKYYGINGGISKVINTEIDGSNWRDEINGLGNETYKSPMYMYGGNVELENVKITNTGDYAIYAAAALSANTENNIRIKGRLEIEGAKKEAISLNMENGSNKNNLVELYIDGDIIQKGNTYTVKAENEGTYTKVHYDNSKIEKGTDAWSNAYYNTKNREGNQPILPNKDSTIVQVLDGYQFVEALANPNIKAIELINDINIKSSEGEPNSIFIKGNEKEIKGNGYIVRNTSGGANWYDFQANTKIDNLKIYGVSIYTNGNNVQILNNSEINGVSIHLDGNISLKNVKLSNSSVSGGEGNLVVDSSKLVDSFISISDYKDKVGIAKIINTEISGKSKYRDAPISLEGGSIDLENVKITNPVDYAIYAKGSKESVGNIRVKGILEINGAKKEAIVLKKGDNNSTGNPVELRIDGDIKQLGDTFTVKAEKEGTYTKVYCDESKIKKVLEKWGYTYYSTKNREGNEPQSNVYENKLVGENRYETASKVSSDGWSSANSVVIVNSNSIPDALSATPFAKYYDAPILLTESNKLNDESKKEILRLNPQRIYIVGGKSVVSDSVINELKSMNISVERISGQDRYETSLELAKELGGSQEIAVVNGVTGLPDAISIAPVAAEKRIPIVLASPNEGTKVFNQYIKDSNVTKSYVIGRESSISNEIVNKLPNPERLGGINRNETNAVILEKFYTSEELNNIYIAKDGMKKSDDLIDALAVGVLAAKEKSPVVIVGNDFNDKQESLLSKKHPGAIIQVGGSGNENAFNKLINMFN